MVSVQTHRHQANFSLAIPVIFQGKYEEAEPMYARSLAIREDVYGPDHINVALGLNNWAEFLMSQVRATRTIKGSSILFFALSTRVGECLVRGEGNL